MSLILETKMADVGKPISLGNLLVRKTTWLVLTTTSATLILSRVFGADCMTRIVYIYSRLPTLILFLLWLPETALSLSPFRLTETTYTLSLIHLTSNCQPHENVYIPQPFSLWTYLFDTTCSSLKNNHRNFVKPPKERNNQHGRRHVPPNIHTLFKFCRKKLSQHAFLIYRTLLLFSFF